MMLFCELCSCYFSSHSPTIVLVLSKLQVSCGEAFSVAVDEDGFMYTTGSSEFGQLANGETGERILTANKVTFDNCNVFTKQTVFTHVPGEKLYGSGNAKDKSATMHEDIRIGHVACGKNHCIAVEAPSTNMASRVFSWGCGNYGCLGHGVQADEHLPRLVGALSQGNIWKSNPPVSASAGASCSMILTKAGHVYYFGKHRSVGEATMRPTLLAELANNGHVAEHVAGGNQTVVVCTQNAVTVAWGMGPHGELGLEDKKSSAKPAFVPKLDSCRMHDIACGYGTTYYIVKKDDKDDEVAIKQLPVVSDATFIELETFVETVSAGKKK
jgi:alpha-tubulin suppressor-like RCC1 family protein